MVNPGSNNSIYYFPVLLSDSVSDFSIIPLESTDGSVLGTGLIDDSGNTIHGNIYTFLTNSGILLEPTNNNFSYITNYSALPGSVVSSITFDSSINDINFIPEVIQNYYTSGSGITTNDIIITDQPITGLTTTFTNDPPNEETSIPTVGIPGQFYPYTVCRDQIKGRVSFYFDLAGEMIIEFSIEFNHSEEKQCLKERPDRVSTGTNYPVGDSECYRNDSNNIVPASYKIKTPNMFWKYLRDYSKGIEEQPQQGIEPVTPFGTSGITDRGQRFEYPKGALHKGYPDINPAASRSGQGMSCDITVPEYVRVTWLAPVKQNCAYEKIDKNVEINIKVVGTGNSTPVTSTKAKGGKKFHPKAKDYSEPIEKDLASQPVTQGAQELAGLLQEAAGRLKNIATRAGQLRNPSDEVNTVTPGQKLSKAAHDIFDGFTTLPPGNFASKLDQTLLKAMKEAGIEPCSCSPGKPRPTIL